MAVSDADSDLDRWGALESNVQAAIVRLIREGKLSPGPDPDLERLARECRVVAVDRETLLAALEEADRLARALDLPRVRIRIANARAEARR